VNLIQDLQKDILNSEASLPSILRKTKVLGSLLRNKEFKKWVDNELNGYQEEDKKKIPSYRRGYVESYGDFLGPFGSVLKNQPISSLSLPVLFRQHVNKFLLVEGVRALESLIEHGSSDFRMQWPADIIAAVSNKIFKGWVCMSAWKLVSRGQIEQVLDTVRNRLLSFVLELEEKHPEISESKDAISNVSKKEISYAFNTYIIGSRNIIASGVGINQKVHQQVPANDLKALLKYMEKINVPSDNLKELEKAIEEDGPGTKPNEFGPKVSRWIERMANKKIVKGAWKLALPTIQMLIMKGLSMFYGWE